MDIMAEYSLGPYFLRKGMLHRILKDRRCDRSSFELARPESVNGRCVDESLHIFEADSQPRWTGKGRDRITSFFGEGRSCFVDLKSRNIGAQFATEKYRWRMPSCASSRVPSMDREFSGDGEKVGLRRNGKVL